jgi:hypothetical protein
MFEEARRLNSLNEQLPGSCRAVNSAWVIAAAFTLCGAAPPSRAASPGVDYCVSRDSTSNGLADFLVNRCRFSVIVKWRDQGSCSSWCQDTVPPNGRQSIVKMSGRATLSACRYPSIPTEYSGNRFRCPDPGEN